MNSLPRKVAILLPSLKFGGAERVSLNLAREMKRMGVEVDILLMSKEGELLEEALSEFAVYDLDCDRTYKLPILLLRYLYNNQPSALISNFWKLNLCAGLIKLAFPFCKVLLWEHSPPSRAPFAPVWLYRLTASLLYQFSDQIVAVSNGVRDDILKCTIGLARKTKTIYNPITPPEDGLVCLDSVKKITPAQIISVGRLAKEKNPVLLINAFAALLERIDANLLIVGDGELRKELEHLCVCLNIESRVTFYGYSSKPYEQILGSDLLVLSSDLEGLPSSVVEALYCGLSIVSTDCPCGPRELLMDDEYGSLVPMNDATALAQAMEFELLNRRSPVKQQLGAQRFFPAVAAQQFIKLIV
jgi:glycosyltransferase involved in cell wall biosynthesis